MMSKATTVPTKLPRISVYLDAETKEKAEKIATNQRRSVSSWVLYLIDKAIKEAEEQGEV